MKHIDMRDKRRCPWVVISFRYWGYTEQCVLGRNHKAKHMTLEQLRNGR